MSGLLAQSKTLILEGQGATFWSGLFLDRPVGLGYTCQEHKAPSDIALWIDKARKPPHHYKDKIFKIGNRMMMAAVGQTGDTMMFTELIGKNIQLYKMKNGYEMSLHAAVNFTRRTLAEMLRSPRPKMVSLLMAGVDTDGRPALYFIDHIATIVKLPFAVHGYGGMFTISILDKFYKPGMQRTEALNLLKMCMNEIQTRFVVDTPCFMVKVVTEKGVEDLGFVDPKATATPTGAT